MPMAWRACPATESWESIERQPPRTSCLSPQLHCKMSLIIARAGSFPMAMYHGIVGVWMTSLCLSLAFSVTCTINLQTPPSSFSWVSCDAYLLASAGPNVHSLLSMLATALWSLQLCTQCRWEWHSTLPATSCTRSCMWCWPTEALRKAGRRTCGLSLWRAIGWTVQQLDLHTVHSSKHAAPGVPIAESQGQGD